MTTEPQAVVVPKTQVPNEMLKNPALSIFSAPGTSGPLTIGANVASGITFSGTGPRIRGPMSTSPNITRLMFQTDDPSSSSFLGIIPGASGTDSALSVYAQPDSTNTHFATLWTTMSPPRVIVGSGKRGSGTTVPLELWTGDTARWVIGADGSMVAGADNAYDIGAPSLKARSLYLGTSLVTAEVAPPPTPAAGQVSIYAKADHKVYALDSTGVETDLTLGTSQAAADARYLRLAGGQMTGTLFTQYVEVLSGRTLTFSGQPSDASIANDGTGMRFRYYGQDVLKIGDGVIFPPVNYVNLGASANRFDTILAKNLDLASAGRIVGDFTAAAFATRTLFQTATSNAGTEVGIIPKGTTTGGAWIEAFNGSDANNAAFAYFGTSSTLAELGVWRSGAGPTLPLRLMVGGNEVMRVFASGGSTSLSGVNGLLFNHNAWYDGAWHRHNTAVGAATLDLDTSVGLALYFAPAGGADPPAWARQLLVSPTAPTLILGSVLTISGVGAGGQVGNVRNGDFGLFCTTPNWMRISANQNIAFWANGQGITADAPQMVLQASDGKLNVTAGIVVTDTWHRVAAAAGGPGFASGWADYAGGWEVYYRLDPFGVCHIQGMASGGALGSTVFTLPVGYRPAHHLMLTVVTYMTGVGDLEITSTGTVSMVRVQAGTYNAGWVNLNCSFLTT
jgi:hypothetical protein